MTLEGGEGSASRPGSSLPPGKNLVSIVQESGWALGPVWTGLGNLAPNGIRSPDRPPRSQSLYRLRYPAHGGIMCFILFYIKIPIMLLKLLYRLTCTSHTGCVASEIKTEGIYSRVN